MRLLKINGKCNICGPKIRQAREKAGLSQEQLAAKLQLQGYTATQKTVSRMESGARLIADHEIPLLAQALHVSPLWLLGLEQEDV